MPRVKARSTNDEFITSVADLFLLRPCFITNVLVLFQQNGEGLTPTFLVEYSERKRERREVVHWIEVKLLYIIVHNSGIQCCALYPLKIKTF